MLVEAWQAPSPDLRSQAPGCEEGRARTTRKMMSNGHSGPGLSSWCRAQRCRLPAPPPRLGAHPPLLAVGPRDGKVPALLQAEQSRKPHPGLR